MRVFQTQRAKFLFASIFLGTNILWGSFYIGVDGGYLGSSLDFNYTTRGSVVFGSDKKDSIYENGALVNLVLGTEHFFGESRRFGIRWGAYGGYGYTQGKSEIYGKNSMQIFQAGAFLDCITNIISKEDLEFGIFGGSGYDFSALKPTNEIRLGFKANPPILQKDSFVSNQGYVHSLLVRMGLTALLSKHHRLELGAQIPFDLSLKIAGFYYSNPLGNIDIQYTFSIRRIQGTFGYKYVF